MTNRITATDAALEAMLARRAHRANPIGLADAVFAAIEATGPRRGPRLTRPAAWLPGRPSRELAWVLVAATLLLALLGSALVGAGLLDRPRPPLSLDLNAIETLTPQRISYDRVVTDGAGTLWAIGTGHLTRLDPGTGMRQTWTVSDHTALASSIVAPAQAGGVWIWSGASILRFAGDGVAESIPIAAADQPTALVETPGGSLWAASWDRGLERWDGSSWVAEPPGRPTVAVGALLLRGEDDLWVSNPRVQGGADPPGGVSHLEGGRWTTYDAGDAAYLGGEVLALEAVADGSIWVAKDAGSSNVDLGIARFDGQSWTVIDGPGFPASRLDAAPDGSVWATRSGLGAVFAPAPNVARYADGQWTRYGAEGGFAGTELGHVSATAAGVFLGTDVGLLRFADERWVPAWPDASDGPRIDAIWDRVLAVSADEVWAAEKRGIWHFVDGSWTGPLRPPGWIERANGWALAPDGTLWVTTDNGVAALRGGQWTLASAQGAGAIAIGPDGTAWAGDGSGIVGLRLDGSPPLTVACPNGSWSIAVTTDGSIYVGAWPWVGKPGLARFDGRTCERVDPLGDGLTVEVGGLHADPTGGLVAVFSGPGNPDGSGPMAIYIARLDGTRWEVLEESDVWPVGVSVSPSGEIWRAAASDPAWKRFDGERWIPVDLGVSAVGPPSIAEDGTIWFLGPYGVQRMRVEEARP